MNLTEEEKRKLEGISKDKLLAIMHECAEILAIVPAKRYSEIEGIPIRTAYQHMKSGKIKYFKIGNHYFPVINKK